MQRTERYRHFTEIFSSFFQAYKPGSFLKSIMAFFSYLFKNLNRECGTGNSKNFQSPKEAVKDCFLAFYSRRFVVVGPTGWTKSGVQ